MTLGKLLALEISTVGPRDSVGIGDIEGAALDAGSNVELPTGTVGIGGTLGC